MTFLNRLIVLFYVTFVLFVGSFLVLFGLRWIDFGLLNKFLMISYIDDNLRMVVASSGGILLLINLLFYRLFSVNVHRDKTIAFDNPDGRVTVSLFALEESAKRAVIRMDEIREVKVSIEARRKKLRCRVRLSLVKEVNIPELTSRVQALVKDKIQDAIGLEETIEISVYVSKIIPREIRMGKEKKQPVTEEDNGVNVPFHGYRA